MYEDETINEVEVGKEYKKEVLEDFITRHNYHLYSKTIGKNFFGNGQAMCVVEKVIEGDYQFLHNNNYTIRIEPIEGIIFAELK